MLCELFFWKQTLLSNFLCTGLILTYFSLFKIKWKSGSFCHFKNTKNSWIILSVPTILSLVSWKVKMQRMSLRSGRRLVSKNDPKPPPKPSQNQKNANDQKRSDPQRPRSPQHLNNPQRPTQRNLQRSNLEDFYTNLQNPLAYSGNTKEILNTLEGFSLHKPRRKIFPRRLTFVPNIYHTIYVTGFIWLIILPNKYSHDFF